MVNLSQKRSVKNLSKKAIEPRKKKKFSKKKSKCKAEKKRWILMLVRNKLSINNTRKPKCLKLNWFLTFHFLGSLVKGRTAPYRFRHSNKNGSPLWTPKYAKVSWSFGWAIPNASYSPYVEKTARYRYNYPKTEKIYRSTDWAFRSKGNVFVTNIMYRIRYAALTFASIFRFIVLIGIIGCWRMEEQFRKNSVKGWCCISQNTSLFYSSRGRLILGCFWKSGSWVSRCYKRPRSKPSFAYGSWSNDKGFTQISNINKSQPIPLVISIIIPHVARPLFS